MTPRLFSSEIWVFLRTSPARREGQCLVEVAKKCTYSNAWVHGRVAGCGEHSDHRALRPISTTVLDVSMYMHAACLS